MSNAGPPAERLTLAGRLDINRVRALHQELLALHDRGVDVVLDWSHAELLDGAALQLLLAFRLALHVAGRRLEPTPASEPVARTLALAGVTHIFSGGPTVP